MRRIVNAAFLLFYATTAFGQSSTTCTTQLSYAAVPALTPVTEQLWTVNFTNCSDVTAATFTKDSKGQLILGGTKYEATIDSFNAPTPLTGAKVNFRLSTAQNDPVNAFYNTNTAVFTYGGQTFNPTVVESLNVRSNAFHVGRVAASGDATAEANAYEFKVDSAYSYRPPYVPLANPTFWSKTQRDFELKVDTTDKKSGFVDDNSVSVGQFYPRLSLGQLFVEGKVGGQVRYERPIHNNDHNLDATATASALLPKIQALNLFCTTKKLASPLSLALSYGYRSQRMTNNNYRGRVFEGTAFYHAYLLDVYRIDLTATTTYNDLNNLAAGASKTQHAFTAQVSYESSPNAPFAAVATYQSGSFGAVATKLKQFFIGVAVTKIDQFLASRGTGGSQ